MRVIEDIETDKLKGKRVLLRLNLDLPLVDGKVTDNFRLKSHLPTINYLLSQGAKLILLGHLGRPKGVEESLRLGVVYDELSKISNHKVEYSKDIISDANKKTIDELKAGEVFGLENLRFDGGEKSNSRTFARNLASYGDIYINDAFSVCHREEASVVAITEFLPSYAGYEVEKEYLVISNLLKNPAKPFAVIIGGAKAKDKLPTIKNLLHSADYILTGGMVGNAFLKATGADVKNSAVEEELIPVAKEIAKRAGAKLLMPTDYIWDGDKIADIGAETSKKYAAVIKSAKTIFWNGNLGITENDNFKSGSMAVAKALVSSVATTIVGGGNTVEFVENAGLGKKISFISSGGGATLAMLAGKKLPGIEALQ